jgi:hypothetical protein
VFRCLGCKLIDPPARGAQHKTIHTRQSQPECLHALCTAGIAHCSILPPSGSKWYGKKRTHAPKHCKRSSSTEYLCDKNDRKEVLWHMCRGEKQRTQGILTRNNGGSTTALVSAATAAQRAAWVLDMRPITRPPRLSTPTRLRCFEAVAACSGSHSFSGSASMTARIAVAAAARTRAFPAASTKSVCYECGSCTK